MKLAIITDTDTTHIVTHDLLRYKLNKTADLEDLAQAIEATIGESNQACPRCGRAYDDGGVCKWSYL
jgi:hypothetical protein